MSAEREINRDNYDNNSHKTRALEGQSSPTSATDEYPSISSRGTLTGLGAGPPPN